MPPTRALVAVIGPSDASRRVADSAQELGRLLVDAGFRVLCGGRGGAMAAVCRGAHSSAAYREGDTVGLLPGTDPAAANPWVDVVLPTGLGLARNAVVATAARAVIAVGGGTGTLSELAFAWQLGKPIVALDVGEGWGTRLAGERLDDRRDDSVQAAESPAEAVALVMAALVPPAE